MRKIIYTIAIIILFISRISAQEIIVNGGFESWSGVTLNSWTSDYEISISESNAIVHSGAAAAEIKLTSAIQENTDLRQSLNLDSGVTYTISVWVYNIDSTARVTIYAAGNWTNKYSNPKLLNQWQQITYQYIASASGVYEFGLRFYDYTGWTNPSYMIIDDFSVREPMSAIPQISDIVTNPEYPSYSNPVNVSATISDDSGISEAYLLYRFDGINFNDSIQMTGTLNGKFTTNSAIPSQNIGTVVYYKIRVVDTSSQQTISEIKSYNLSSIEAGDVAFIQYHFDNPDAFSFLTLRDLPANTQITFTDNAWTGDSLTTVEGNIYWTSPNNLIPAGTIISYDSTGNFTLGTHTIVGIPDFSDYGDVLFAYTGASSNPTFICGISTTTWLTTGTVNTNYSYLPSTLADGITALSFTTENDNGFYTPTGIWGTKVETLLSIFNESNWTFEDDPILIPFQEDSVWEVAMDVNFIENSEKISIYPNPVSNYVTINSNTNISNISITNILGETIKEFEINQNTLKINLEPLHNGLYFIYLTDKNKQIKTFKIIKN